MSDLAKGFPAFPARKRRTRRAQTWWGNAWIDALENASLDSDALRRGRAFAHGGHVGTITVSPGRISATVYGDDHTPTETAVFLEEFTGPEWDRLLDQIAAKAGHVAALLAREMPDDLVDIADDAGVGLLPGIGDLEPQCTCDDWGHPCTHAAALCYQASWLLDTDPFLLLLMRGRADDDILAELQRRNAEATMPEERSPSRSVPLPTPPSALDPATIERVRAEAAARATALLSRTTT
jgi:uncharacterized Zn finger protein